jgi:DNA-binding NtrC family response regulator
MANAPSMSMPPVMLVDDETQILEGFEMMLHSAGIRSTICCQDSREVMPLLAERQVSAILLDLNMPPMAGQELLQLLAEHHPKTPVIIVTGVDELRTAIDCMKMGAYDYLVKPPDEDQLVSSVRRAIEASKLRQENQSLKERILSEELRHPECFSAIITKNQAMLARLRYVEAVAASGEPILITGETGVGKELFAQAVHALSCPQGPFVAVNAAGLDDHAFSDTLFGHKRGAFTGADERRDGLIKKAAGGTLFLDEIGDLTLSSQIKLLRLLQEHEYFPLGSDLPQLTNARIVVSTHRDLGALMGSEKFRADLYYRFRTHELHVPSLRERIEDIPLLLDHFLEKSARKLGKNKPTPPDELVLLLSTYDFPGNVREFEAMVHDAVSNHESGVLSMKRFKSLIPVQGGGEKASAPVHEQAPFANVKKLPSLREVPDLLVAEAMRRSNGNQSLAARLLGVTQSALSQRLKKLARG